MRRAMLTSLLMAASALAAQPALAEMAVGAVDLDGVEAGLVPMDTQELAAERGGLLTPYGEVNFGAVLRTIIDGKIAMETQLTWTPQGPVQSVISNIGSTIQNATNVGPKTPVDFGATNTALQQAGQQTLQNLPGMQQVAEGVGAGIDEAALEVGQTSQPGATLVGLAGQFVPPNNPSLDTVFETVTDAKLVPTPPPQLPTVGLGVNVADAGAVDTVGGVLDFTATGDPAATVQSVTGATPTDADDPIGALVVAATTQGQTPQQVADAAAALGINLGQLTGGNAMLVAGETGGATAIVQNIADGSFSNMVFNTASNQNIRIETDIEIVMPELEQFQQQILSDQLQINLHDAIGAALVNAGL